MAAVVAGIALLLAPISPLAETSATAASTPISLLTNDTAGHVADMSFLATRSESKSLTKSGVGPYVMSHTNADPSLSYSYPTDANYGVYHSYTSNDIAQLVESDVRAASSMSYSYASRTTSSAKLVNSGNIATRPTGSSSTNTTVDGTKSYGSIFGPQVWSEPFVATASQAVSFQWKAQGGSDDYEVYGFLVKIADQGTCSASTDFGGSTEAEKVASHTILAHGRGKSASVFNTASGNIPADGCYRFRFVNGTYDASGGYAVGATFEIQNPTLGLGQTITLTQLADRVLQSSSYTETLAASTNAGQTVTFAEHGSSSVCSVASDGTVTIASTTGQCTVRADAAATGNYAAAPTVFMSFNVLASATKPSYSGGATITGSALVCSTLTAVEGDWASGGASISSTDIQWLRSGTPISGATASTYALSADDVGESISFSVTKTNSVGSTTATSSGLLAIDARLTGLSLSSGTLSPSFDSCASSYSVTSTSDTLIVTPAISSGADGIQVNSIEVLSGEPTNPISLNPGSNTVTLSVSSGIFSRDITVTVNYLSAPTVIALTPTMTSGTEVTLQASINANGYTTSSLNFTITQTSGATQAPTQAALSASSASGTSAITVTQVVTDLVSGGTYEFVAEAINANGTATSQTITFQTPDAPTVTTGNATNVDATSADLAGTVLGHSRDTNVNLVYSTNSDLSSATTVPLSSILAANAGTVQNVSQSLSGLTTGVTYYYRFEADNSVGSNFGDTSSFVTIAAPTITHGSHTIGERSVTLVATVNVNGADTNQDIEFSWSTDVGFTSPTVITATPARLVAGGDRLVSVTVSSLTPATEYWFKVTAANSAGSTTSTPESVTTSTDPVPSVTLQAPAKVDPMSPISLTVRFSEVVTGLQSTDLSITTSSGGPAYSASAPQDLGSGLFQLTLTTSSSSTGTVTIGLPANKVTDAGGQYNTAATSIQVTVDVARINPTISLSYASPSDAPAATPTLNTGGSTGTATYSVLSYTASDAADSCSVNSSTGVASATSEGVCKIGVTIAQDSSYLQATTDALVTLQKSSDTITWDTGTNAVTIRSVAGVNRTTTLTDSDSDGVYELELKLGEMVKIGFNTPNSQRVGYSSYTNCPSKIGWDQSQMFPIDSNGDSFYYLKASRVGACNISGGTHVAQYLSLPSAIYTTPLSEGILISVVKGDQPAISVTGDTSPSFGETVSLSAIGGAGVGDRSYAVTGTGCSITTIPLIFGGVTYSAFSSAELTNTGAGACQVTVTKNGDTNYESITSSALTVTFGKGPQEISFTSSVPTSPVTGGTYTPQATASSGLSVSFAASGSCSISAGVITFNSTGNCTITASQSGDSDYLAANSATQVIDVGVRNQTITFASIADKEFGDPAFSVAPSTSEPGAVITITSANNSVCTVDSNGIVRIVSAGTCTIHADQAGTAGVVAAASRVSRSFEVFAAGSSAPFITGVSRGLGSLTATLIPPSYTGGANITRYEIQAFDPNGDIAGVNNNCSVANPGDPQKCTVEGLAQGVSYTLRARAHHSGGVGSLSPASTAAAPVGNPDAVRELTALANNTSLTISWLAPLDLGGAAFDRYELYIKLSTDGSFPSTPDHIINSSTSGDHTFTGLTNGASYDVKMVTITDLDTTEIISNSAVVSQVPFTTPNSIRNLAAFELGSSLYITWQYPDFDGGRAITSYEVDVNFGDLGCSVTEMVCVVSKGSVTTFDIDALAVNVAGSGPVNSITFALPSSTGSTSSRSFIAQNPVKPQVFAPELARQRPVVQSGGLRVVELRGLNLDLISEVTLGTTQLNFETISSQLLRVYLQASTLGTLELILKYASGELEQTITVQKAAVRKVNAGTFKGYVAIYAKGYEGSALSAKVGKDWVIVDNISGRFVRIMEKVDLIGYPINVRIYIDRRLVMTVPMVTRY